MLCVFGWWQVVWNSPATGTRLLASNGAFESSDQCLKERRYLEDSLALIPAAFRDTRAPDQNQPPRECVSFIMQNFMPLNSSSSAVSSCSNPAGEPARGGYLPCVTETYTNSVYNSLVDVGDCLNIPVKELLPKLFNESGLHVNVLGGGYDAGVGQLTVSALREVFMHYNDTLNEPSALDWYVREIKKIFEAIMQKNYRK